MTRLHRLVAVVAVVGAAACVAAAAGLRGTQPVLSTELPHGAVLACVVAFAVVADLAHVRVRRGSEAEDLTVLEAALVPAVLLLPAAEAVWVPAVAVATTSVLQGRSLLKSAFNVGSAGASAAAFVVLVHAVSGPGVGLGWPTVVGLVAGLLAYGAVDLLAYARLLAVLGEREVRHVVRDGARLGAISAAATVSVFGGAALAATTAPAMLPFSAVPAAAMLVALRATASAAEQRERGVALLALSQVLAGRGPADALVPAFLAQCRQVFDADVALVVPADDGMTSVDARRSAAQAREVTDDDRALGEGADGRVLRAVLPDGCTTGIAAPLEADGQVLGTLVLGTADRRAPLREDQLPLLVQLASALAVALQGAAQSRRLVEATGRLQDVVDQSSDGILVVDGAGTVELWSPGLAALTGVPAAAAEGRALTDALAVVDDAPADAGWSGLTPQAPRAMLELVVVRPDGTLRTLRCAHAAVFDGDALVRDVVLLHDVTREREVERLKADFVATVSHELRTPVTPIKGYADLLRRRWDDMTRERREECLAVIVDRCDHLARLVEDLLLASRISATDGAVPVPVQVGPHDLAAVVRAAAAQTGDGAAARLHLTLPGVPLLAVCDPARTAQVLAHLLDNALKYSPHDEPVDLALAEADGRAVVTVRDRGPGIPDEQLERVFEKFTRLEDPLRMTTGGAGLGLYLARHLATAMGGALSCESTVGGGSTFVLQLPLVGAAPPRSDGAPVRRGAGRSLHACAGLR